MARDTVGPYNRGFQEFSQAFEAFGFHEIHRGALAFLPKQPGLLLDIGAGSGRDADWFAVQGWDVIAVEPAGLLRQDAMRRHPSARIRWVDDRLPSLAAIHRLGFAYDLIWISGVWVHIPPEERPRALRKIASLLRPGGRIALTLRHGPQPDDRPMWPVDAFELERLGLDLGLSLRAATERADDLQGRPGVTWQTVVLDLPDDGGGALPLLRGVILNQEKSATYKLALLRCIARIADTSPNAARDRDDHVTLPLGLVALTWIRMFKPLVAAGLPQRPDDRMGFVGPAFRALDLVTASDLRVGAQFRGGDAEALRRALGDASRLIADMPARHLTYGDDTSIFPTRYGRLPKQSETLGVDMELLWTYGETDVPLAVWQALRRMAAWIEPMLVAEWLRLTQVYAAKQGRDVLADTVLTALRWIEPERDTSFVRGLARRRLEQGHEINCVWSGRGLGRQDIDIDHCLPWSAWPCGDLWNLLPAAPAVNRHGKRDRLVAGPALSQARPLIVEWWQRAYVEGDLSVRKRFEEEIRTTLPVLAETTPDMESCFQALDFRRLRLQQDTRIAEWPGVG